MKRSATTALTASAAAALLALAVAGSAGCASRPTERAASSTPPRPALSARLHRLAQLDFGRDARFAVCAGPACPAATPKTLASPEAPRAESPAEPPAASAGAAPAPVAADPPPAPSATSAAGTFGAVASAPAIADRPRQLVVVHFPSGRSSLGEAGQSTLRSALALARASERIVIHGRTDSTGSDEANQALALARALAVRDYIRTQIPDLPNLIAISARGNCCFVAGNDSAEGRLRNRRVEVVFELRREVRA
jgi:outer membrane protein OmpA-like peptidoglycan-associated protein